MYYKRKRCKGCGHRRTIDGTRTGPTICHYLLDTGKMRGCPPDECPYYTTKKFLDKDIWNRNEVNLNETYPQS